MSNIPNDPVMLLSYINTQLRDNYSSLKDLCKTLDLCQEELEEKLRTIDYVYENAQNQFI
jgi:hypothetical protein